MPRRRVVVAVVAATAAVVAVVAVGLVWPGLDAQQTPPADSAVWALQTADGRRYARVNTAIGELDTVRDVANPSAVAQDGDAAYVFSDSFGKLTRIDPALPVDLDDETVRESPATPAGTVDAVVAGDYVAYRTDAGAVFAGTLSGGGTQQIDPDPDRGGDAPQYSADAIAVDDAGTVYSWSRADGAVTRYAIADARVSGRDEVSAVADGASPTLTAAGGSWVMVDAATQQLWRRGSAQPLALTGAASLVGDVAAAVPSSEVGTVYLADRAGLVAVPSGDGAPERVYGGDGSDLGAPARPVVAGGAIRAAWLGRTAGTLWQGDGEVRTLDYGGAPLPSDDPKPVFVTSGSSTILNETRAGWVWSVPDGALLPSSQDWSLDDRTNPESEQSDQQATVVIDPKPPVAEPDAFGVRAGSLTALPVLLNDHDPNEDVLSIDPASVTGLDPGFGTVTVTDSGQRLAVAVSASAAGTATFTYRVTDGTAGDGGLYSPATTVTLTAVPGATESAPQWCATPGCLARWPEPEVAAGGTVSVPVLDGWVDPEGDPLMLLSATVQSGEGAVATTPAGDVVYQHPDASVGEDQVVQVQVTVGDTLGAVATRALTVTVSAAPKLSAQSFTVVDTVGAAVTVDVGPHVTGTQGRLAVTAARVLDDANAQAVPSSGGTTFDFTAADAGTYRVGYTVGDGRSETSATARITLLGADAPAQLATAPVVAFVHPKEDVTVDVFTAVANPTRRVLLLSDVQPSAAAGASMSVDVVAQNYLRVSGTTADGSPGILGTVRYIVSDGSDDIGARVEGLATVYLLPSADELAPIAVDDAVSVRAGAQVDIPVLDNDVATSSGTMTLNPASISADGGALAFASGRTLRYLAPTEPGTYHVTYSIYSSGNPALADSASVTVTVTDDESNRPPRPEVLEGRVLSGQVTTIPFHSFGVDPDGDEVTLDRITSQPTSGSATVSADGESIVYTSVAGFHGQTSFAYRVVDGEGATGEATVRVGVLDEQANPSPVTFTDYVQVQVGETNAVRVEPLANDVDPTGGTLKITGVAPDTVSSLVDGSPNPEYTRLASLIDIRSDTLVLVHAGDDPGTMSFLYDVESSSGNTARGLIVVKVVRDSVPDYPVVADTALTAETRDRFPDGVDVVAGKVSWGGGDVSDLTLSLWGEPQGVTVDGSRLRGALPAHTRVIPFALSGTSASGETVTGYGFLRVPGDDDLTLALKAGTEARQVTEGQSVSWDMADLVSAPRGAQLEIGDGTAATGARKGAVCVRESGTAIRYDAGDGAPWADACVVPVRVVGQDAYTYLSVPIRITARDPQPSLRAASLTVGPGQTATYDLQTMTTWQGREEWDAIRYSLQYTGGDFRVTLEGSIVTIVGADAAVPGAEEAAVVGVTSHDNVAPARLILRVGAAPSILPQGGTVAQQCSQAAGTSCTIAVVGAPGEVNPLPGTPLAVTAVRGTGACAGVQFTPASDSSVTATWTADAAGATCTASFTLRDAQGRVTAGDRDGRLLLDLQGYPKAPASIAQIAYGDGSVTLRIDPGLARQAYPALTGFTVRSQGQVVATCTVDGVCPAIAAPNGEQRTYEAVAVNAVGESQTRVSTPGWAFRPPLAPTSVSATPVVAGDAGGDAALTIGGIEVGQTASLQIVSPVGETLVVPVTGASVTVPRFHVGSNAATPVSVTPVSRFALPPGLAGSTSGQTRVVTANGVGAPLNPTLSLSSSSNGDGTATISASGGATVNGDGSSLRFGIVADGAPCVADQENAGAATFRVPDGVTYTYRLCAESWYPGVASPFGRAEATAQVNARQSENAPTGYTFVVDGTPNVDAGGAQWIVRAQPSSPEQPPRNNHVEVTGLPSSAIGRDPGIQVRYVHDVWGTATAWATATPAAGSAPYQVEATWSVQSCEGGKTIGLASSSTDGQAAIAFDRAGARYFDAQGVLLAQDRTGLVPAGATRVEIGVTADWSAQSWGLRNAAATLAATCQPAPPATP